MNCETCEVKSHCQGVLLAYTGISKRKCCFGGDIDWCQRDCNVGELCRLKKDAPGNIAIQEEWEDTI